MDLRRAAQRVRILDLVAPAMRLVDRRPFEETDHIRSRVTLARQRAQDVNLRHEARPGALQCLERQRARDVRNLGEPARSHETQRTERSHELRPVDEGEPFLRLEVHRREADGRECLAAVHVLAVDACLALADERKREVGQRRQIPARADRAAARDVRQDAAIQTVEQELRGLDPRTRAALCERIGAQEHRRAHDVVGIRLAHTARVASQQSQLQLVRQLFRDRLGDEPAEARIHAVRVLARSVSGTFHDEPCGAHLVARLVRKLGGRAVDRDAPDVLDPEVVAGQRRRCDHGGECSPRSWGRITPCPIP